MQKDKDLHKLFRARLPVATLPPAFADRLTKTILDEVATLRQVKLLCKDASTEPSDSTSAFSPAPPTTHLPFSCTFSLLLLFLLTHVPLWSSTLHPALVQAHETITGQVSQMEPLVWVSSLFVTFAGLHNTAHLLFAPPLPPIKPQLPIVGFLQHTLVLPPPIAFEATPVKSPDPPSPEVAVSQVITLTLPYEQADTAPTERGVTPDTGPITQPTEADNEPTTALTPTPNSDLPIFKSTATVTPLVFSATPTLFIFEPTSTPTRAEAEATVDPTVPPQITLRPWSTETPTAIP